MNMNADLPFLRMFHQTSSRRVDTSLVTVGVVAAAILFAVLVGSMAGQGSWLFLGLLVGALLAILWPIEVALGLYALLLPFNSVTALGQEQSGTTLNLLVGAMAGAAILGTGLMRNRLRWPPRAAWLWLLFLGWNFLTVAWALRSDVALHELVTPVSVILLYLAAVSWPITEKQLSRLSYLTVAGGCAASWIVIYLFSSGVNWRVGTSRASLMIAGQETNPDRLAALLILPLALATAEFLEAKNWWGKTMATLAAASLAYAMLITMSRACLVAMAVIFGVYALRMGFTRRVFIMLGVLSCMTALMPATFFERLRNALDTGGDGRLDIWLAGFAALKKYWLLGAGFANFPVAYSDFAGLAKSFRGYDRASHNMYLQVGVELGIVGVVLLALVLYTHFRQFWQVRSAEGNWPASIVALEAASWALLAFGLFGDLLWEKGFWLVLMFSLMAIRSRQHSTELARKPGEIGELAYGRRYSGRS